MDSDFPVMQCEECGTICNLLARRSDITAISLPMGRHNAKSIVVVRVKPLLLLRPSSSRRRLLRPTAARCLQSPLCWCPTLVNFHQEYSCALPASKSCQRRIVILLLSNSPSYSSPAFFVFSPAVLRVSPQLKSSNFQNAYAGSTKFQMGSDSK